MYEIALYRKYRPHKFKDVHGQGHILKVLQGSIEQKNISHAYLFSGSRGTGKTSVARIFAHEIGASDNDIYEIDAASNRGIDDVRELREGVNVLPLESPYKVYIIDEVHMLTKEAFNALLKTLEEPPPHAIFILATTELDKLPDTIISRCQTFSFKKPGIALLKDIVIDIAKKEGFNLEGAAGELIALLGDGSFRDTEVILQKIISSADSKKITIQDVETVTGSPKSEMVNNVIRGLHHIDAELALKAINEAVKETVDMAVFAKLILQKVRAVLLLRYAPIMEQDLADDFSEHDFAELKKMAAEKNLGITSATVVELLLAADAIGRSSLPQLPLELTIMKLVGQNKES
jgi:DNA polymerase III subunit gamma/tau